MSDIKDNIPPSNNLVSLDSFRNARPQNTPPTPSEVIPQPKITERTYEITTPTGSVRVTGLIALTSEFLAVGDMQTGIPRFVVSHGNWATVEDVTDKKTTTRTKKSLG